jgi:hypothetical protein
MTNTKLITFVLLTMIYRTSVAAQYSTAEVRELNSKNEKVYFNLVTTKDVLNNQMRIKSQFKKEENIELEETAVIDAETAEIINYNIINNQTGETGAVVVNKNSVLVTYTEKNKPPLKKEFTKPNQLVAPANFDLWIQKNFEILKKEKSMAVNFLVWDRLETIEFKVSYLGLENHNNVNLHAFKMNINNFIFAAFISPIKVWYNKEVTQIHSYKGRVAVRNKIGTKLSDFDGDLIYYYK